MSKIIIRGDSGSVSGRLVFVYIDILVLEADENLILAQSSG